MSSEIVMVTFRIEDGTITEVTERWPTWEELGPAVTLGPRLTGRSDIERAVARVVNAPVGGREERAEEKL